MVEVTVSEAGHLLSELIDRARSGTDVVIVGDDGNRVRLVPIEAGSPTKPQRSFGAFKGKIRIDARFFEPLPSDELAGWGTRKGER